MIGHYLKSGTVVLLGRYAPGPVKLFAGYENIRFANPSIPLSVGSTIIGGYALGTANNAAFTNNKVLQAFWTGAKHTVRPDLDLIVAYYRETQNSSSGNGCTNASLQCAGQLNAFSFLADYKLAKRWDAYAGIMYSELFNGLASGFFATNSIDPTIGLHFRF